MKTIQPSQILKADQLLDFIKSFEPTLEVSGTAPDSFKLVCPPDSPEANPQSLSFIRSTDSHQISKAINQSSSGTFLISNKSKSFEAPAGKLILRVKQPHVAYVRIMEKYFLDREERFLPQNIHSTAVIDPSAEIAANVKIGAYVVIGADCVIEENVVIFPHVVMYQNVSVGANSTIHAHCVIREHSEIGKNCCIQPGAVIGSDGFGYVQDSQIGLRPVPQVGIVEIADGVDIGSNSCLDRAAAGVTKIGLGTKVDNLVQIGHNVEVGSHSIVCGQAGIGGSSKIGDQVVLGGKVGVGDHMKIASGVRIGGAGIVISHVTEPGDYMGYPVQPAFKWRRSLAAQLALPEFMKSLRKKDEKN